MTEALVAIFFLAAVVAAGLYFNLRQRLADTEQWLRDELTAHEKTRQHLRDAAARMRRENRDRVLGIIEGQRGA